MVIVFHTEGGSDGLNVVVEVIKVVHKDLCLTMVSLDEGLDGLF